MVNDVVPSRKTFEIYGENINLLINFAALD